MAVGDEWLMPLTPADIREIEQAVEWLIARDADIAAISVGDFPLPSLGSKLKARVRDEVLNGRGFLLMRGLPVERWNLREAATAYFGLGAHLGSARSQNAKGHVLGHVQDLGLDAQDPNVRIYQTSARQTFHTDSCDIVALLCLKTARSGGLSALVSSSTIFNEMRRRPDLLALLLEPIATDRRGEVPPGQKPFFEIPVFNWYAGHLSAIYQRQYIESAQRFADAPRLTPAHREALDLFDALAGRSGAEHDHGIQARRRAVRAQPYDPARPDRIRGLAGAGAEASLAALVAGRVGRARGAAGLCPEIRIGDGRRPRRRDRRRHAAARTAAGRMIYCACTLT
jgi:hypothetical protein